MKYRVLLCKELYVVVRVDADDEDEAIAKALGMDLDGQFVEESLSVDAMFEDIELLEGEDK